MRLNKYIVELGICSRRKADDLIASGKVLLNNSVAVLGSQLKDGDELEINSQVYIFRSKQKDRVYLALNKPASYITSFEEGSKNLNDLIQEENFLGDFSAIKDLQLHYAGRLDKDSSGLLLLTNDGDLSYKLTHPKFLSEKEYLVETQADVSNKDLQKLANGVEIDPEDNGDLVKTNPCFIEKLEARKLRIILNQGFKRQIRLMLKSINNRVIQLKRIRIANIALKEYKIFNESTGNKAYTNMIILDDLAESQFCLINKPETSDEARN